MAETALLNWKWWTRIRVCLSGTKWSPKLFLITEAEGCILCRSYLHGMWDMSVFWLKKLLFFYHLLRLKVNPSSKISTTCSTLVTFPTFTILRTKTRSWQLWSLLFEIWGSSPPRPIWWLHTQHGFAAISTWSCAWGTYNSMLLLLIIPSLSFGFQNCMMGSLFPSPRRWRGRKNRSMACITLSPRTRYVGFWGFFTLCCSQDEVWIFQEYNYVWFRWNTRYLLLSAPSSHLLQRYLAWIWGSVAPCLLINLMHSP